ncbi:MAG: PAS domain S-box protein, partial [Magnetococcales bacterium]|nr:PAS domain S-box protein [Magnetococcales bacterium]
LLTESRFRDDLNTLSRYLPEEAGLLSLRILDPGGDLTTGHQPVSNHAAWPLTTMASRVLTGEEGVDTQGYRDYRGVPVVGAWQWSQRLGVGLTTEIDVNEALSSYFDMRRLVLASLIGISLLALLLTAVSIWIGGRTRKQLRERVDARTAELRKLVQAVKQSPICVVVTDVAGTIEYVNPTFTAVTGYRSDEVIGGNPSILNSGETPEALFTEMWQTILAGEIWRGELRNRRKNGELYWASISIAPVTDKGDTLTHFVAMTEDITELKLSEERINLALEGGNLGYWDVDFQTGEMVVNDRWAEMLGYQPHELPHPVRQTWKETLHPEDRARVLEEGRAYRSGKLERYAVEYRAIAKDGSTRWLISQGAAMEYREDGEPTRMVGTVQDITRRKTMETALSESEERSRLILESGGDGIFGLDIDGNTTFVNPAAAAMLGYTEKELTGVAMHAAVHHSRPDGTPYPKEACHMRAAFRDGRTRQVNDEYLWRKDGTGFPVEYSSVPIRKGEKLVGAVVIFRDISARLQIERELRDKLDELQKFSSVAVGRELRMIALKEEINELCLDMGEEARYEIPD